MIGFHRNYFLLFLFLLLVEVGIASWAHDDFIRPYAGDFLAPILLYCLIRSFFAAAPGLVALAALLFSYLVEASQYFHFLAYSGLQHFRLARIVFGNHFEWTDIIAYTLGTLLILAIEQIKPRGKAKKLA